jgi:hypothetical protein
LGEVGLVALGVALPVAAYTFVYWRLGALAELGRALLITPGLYVEEFDQNVPDIRYAFATILPLVIGWLLLKLEDRPRRLIVIGLLVLLPVSYYFNPTAVILAMFVTLMWLGLFVGVAVLRKSDRSVTMHFAAVALVSGAMCFQLIRFPASNLYYMMHAVPLLVLAAMVLAGSYQPRSTRLLVVGFIAVLGTLVVAKLDGRLFAGQAPFERDPYVAMQVPRGNLRIPSSTAYIDDLALSIDDHVKEGDFVLAGPDSPEVYYLAQVRNETPVFFDFLSQARDETLSTAKYLGSLSPDVFVNNREPARSRPVQESEIPSSCARAGSFGPRDVFVACG